MTSTAGWRSRLTGRLRETSALAVGLYLVAALAWLATVRLWVPMPAGASGSAASMARPGVPEAMATSAGVTGWTLYLGMWGVMMVAMMYPSSVPLVRTYARTLEGQSRQVRAFRVGGFLGAYTLVWTATGVLPLLANTVLPIARVAGSPLALGATLLVLAGYQLSPYKDRCLRHCRTPLGFLMQYQRPGVRGAARLGVRHAAYCLGCCWALFALVVVVGTMNLVWMVAVTLVLSLERTAAWGELLATSVGVAAGIAGTTLLVLALA